MTCEDDGHKCENGGTCNEMYKFCECKDGFRGAKCEISEFNCSSMTKSTVSKCKGKGNLDKVCCGEDAGSCNTVDNKCECEPGYFGK